MLFPASCSRPSAVERLSPIFYMREVLHRCSLIARNAMFSRVVSPKTPVKCRAHIRECLFIDARFNDPRLGFGTETDVSQLPPAREDRQQVRLPFANRRHVCSTARCGCP